MGIISFYLRQLSLHLILISEQRSTVPSKENVCVWKTPSHKQDKQENTFACRLSDQTLALFLVDTFLWGRFTGPHAAGSRKAENGKVGSSDFTAAEKVYSAKLGFLLSSWRKFKILYLGKSTRTTTEKYSVTSKETCIGISKIQRLYWCFGYMHNN